MCDGQVIDVVSGEFEPRLRGSNEIVRCEEGKTELWAVPMPEFEPSRLTAFFVQDGGMGAVLGNGICVWELATAKELWRSKDAFRPAATCSGVLVGVRDGDLVGVSLRDGSVRFVRPLDGAKCHGFLVHDGVVAALIGKAVVLMDRNGRQLGRLENESVLDVTRMGDVTVVATKSQLFAFDARGDRAWTAGHRRVHSMDDGVDILATENGHVAIARFCPHADSGVRVELRDASTGKVVWKKTSPPRGIAHSKFHHRAYLQLRGERLVVVSQGPQVVEMLDLGTGVSQERFGF